MLDNEERYAWLHALSGYGRNKFVNRCILHKIQDDLLPDLKITEIRPPLASDIHIQAT